jgi:hypothetical protein
MQTLLCLHILYFAYISHWLEWWSCTVRPLGQMLTVYWPFNRHLNNSSPSVRLLQQSPGVRVTQLCIPGAYCNIYCIVYLTDVKRVLYVQTVWTASTEPTMYRHSLGLRYMIKYLDIFTLLGHQRCSCQPFTLPCLSAIKVVSRLFLPICTNLNSLVFQ